MRIKAFGIARDIIGEGNFSLELEHGMTTVDELKHLLMEKYPKLSDIHSFAIAVNASYAGKDEHVKEVDEVAIIPPVSGG